MRVFPLLAVALAFVPGAVTAQGSAFDLEPGTRVLAPITHKQLAIFPVVRATAAAVDKTQYLTLADGLSKKLVMVTEHTGGAQVNRVTVRNNSERPLLLLGGEIILGGQQDRVLGRDTVVPARESATLEVFCVEHGRWSGKREFNASGGFVDGKVRKSAKYDADQQRVWSDVAKKTAALKADSPSGTYRTLSGERGDAAVKPYREQIGSAISKLADGKNMVGVIAAINGRVTSVDVWATPELFSAYRDKLLDGIYLSAADTAVTIEKPPEAAEIRAFVREAEAAPEKEVAKSAHGTTTEKRSPKVLNSTVKPAAPAAAPVYKSYQANE
jgi:hypothetical protein